MTHQLRRQITTICSRTTWKLPWLCSYENTLKPMIHHLEWLSYPFPLIRVTKMSDALLTKDLHDVTGVVMTACSQLLSKSFRIIKCMVCYILLLQHHLLQIYCSETNLIQNNYYFLVWSPLDGIPNLKSYFCKYTKYTSDHSKFSPQSVSSTDLLY